MSWHFNSQDILYSWDMIEPVKINANLWKRYAVF